MDTLTVDSSNAVANPVSLIRYQYRDHLGSATMETNETGQVISYEEYHPFGTSAYRVAKSGTDLSLKHYRFTNKERDDETGLYYFGVRYYAAWLGRWTSSDPGDFVDGLNLYVYVRNNPVNGVDELGYETDPPPENLTGRGEVIATESEDRGQFDGVEKEDRITPRFSFDENNEPVVTIVVTGKVIDYTEQGTSLLWGESAAEAIARRINAFGNNELWVGENGLFTTSVSKVDASGFKIEVDGEVREFDEITVKFEFNFEAAESIIEASPDDHVIALLPPPSTDRHKGLEPDRKINGATSASKMIAFVNINHFTGLKD